MCGLCLFFFQSCSASRASSSFCVRHSPLTIGKFKMSGPCASLDVFGGFSFVRMPCLRVSAAMALLKWMFTPSIGCTAWDAHNYGFKMSGGGGLWLLVQAHTHTHAFGQTSASAGSSSSRVSTAVSSGCCSLRSGKHSSYSCCIAGGIFRAAGVGACRCSCGKLFLYWLNCSA